MYYNIVIFYLSDFLYKEWQNEKCSNCMSYTLYTTIIIPWNFDIMIALILNIFIQWTMYNFPSTLPFIDSFKMFYWRLFFLLKAESPFIVDNVKKKNICHTLLIIRLWMISRQLLKRLSKLSSSSVSIINIKNSCDPI